MFHHGTRNPDHDFFRAQTTPYRVAFRICDLRGFIAALAGGGPSAGRELGEIPMLQADKPLQQSTPADEEIHPNMVLIPGDTFRMGSDKR